MMEQGPRRCPSCGALAAWEMEWCGQCLSPLERPLPSAPPASAQHAPQFYMDEPQPAARTGLFVPEMPAPQPPTGAVPPAPVAPRRPTWPCAVCETENPIELDTCVACGAPFARLFQEPESRPKVDPRSAVARSLLFPGLGQVHCGRTADGVARAVLFLWIQGTATVMLLSRGGSGSAITPIALLFLAVSVMLYATSALDAYRQAAGDAPLLTPRYLLYGTVGLIILSVGSLFLLVTRAAQVPR
jgi:hypothetical protein